MAHVANVTATTVPVFGKNLASRLGAYHCEAHKCIKLNICRLGPGTSKRPSAMFLDRSEQCNDVPAARLKNPPPQWPLVLQLMCLTESTKSHPQYPRNWTRSDAFPANIECRYHKNAYTVGAQRLLSVSPSMFQLPRIKPPVLTCKFPPRNCEGELQ